MLKIFRKVTPGEHPEAEMGRYLTANGFANSPTLLGEVTRIDKQGERHSLAVAQGFIRNQGDGWTWTLNQFERAVDDLATHEADARADKVEDYQTFAATIGRQLAAMHTVLARDTDDEAFAPKTADATRRVALDRPRAGPAEPGVRYPGHAQDRRERRGRQGRRCPDRSTRRP